MSCSNCNGCKENKIQSMKVSERILFLKECLDNIEDMNNKGINIEEILYEFIEIEKNVKILRNQFLEKYIEKDVGLKVQQGNIEVLEDLMLLIKKLN